jgi:hypothetical protein
MFNEIAKKLMVGALAGVLLLGASYAMGSQAVRYVVVGLQTASGGDVEPTQDLCMPQLAELKTQGFEFVDKVQLEAKLIAFYLQRAEPADAATLFCYANNFVDL